MTPGDTLGPYEIVGLLGAGGMGEVYRARDTKLDREVAIKVLPAALAQHPERLARFEREAKVLAALNHPNIAGIYGLEDRAIVMELVEGPTLADRIAEGAIPLDESLKIAAQIADALEAAHEKGVVHRDLKPANIKVRDDGTVKVLDFGLATAVQASGREPGDGANSPTLTMGATEVGMILGTAAYMSPEQAAGKPVDRRADIWSFGVVLWEMLTGKRLFGSDESVSHTLADVLRAGIDFSKLPTSTPAPIRELLRRCLDRGLKTRLRDIGEARIAIQKWVAHPVDVQNALPPPRLVWVWPSLAALCLLVAVAVSFIHFRERSPAAPEPVRFQFPLPEKATFGQYLSLSPDGRRVVFLAATEGGMRLWVHSLDSLGSRPLAGTEGVAGVPFWSPDSRFIAFGVQGKLRKIEAAGGPPQTLCDLPGTLYGGFWTRDNTVVFGTNITGVLQVPAGGGVASAVTTVNRERGDRGHEHPALLPDGRHFVYLRNTAGENSGIYLGSLDAKPEQQDSKRLLGDLSSVVYAPSADPRQGYLLFVRENTLMAQPFDGARLAFVGDAVAIAEQVGNLGSFSAVGASVLTYSSAGGGDRQLAWFDRQGKSVGAAWIPGEFFELNLSPDGTRVGVVRRLGTDNATWTFEFARNAATRLATGIHPVWSPDGSQVVYSGIGSGYGMEIRPASGAGNAQQLLKSNHLTYAFDWSRDGRFLLYADVDPKTKYDLWVLPMSGGRKPQEFLHTPFDERQPQFSPDGRFVAYASDESGKYEVYVSTFPPSSAGKWPISNGGGYQPRWRRDGKELLYFSGGGTLMSVEVALGATFKAGVPKALFQAPLYGGGANPAQTRWDLTPDRQRFLINTIPAEASSPLTVVLNWQAGLKK